MSCKALVDISGDNEDPLILVGGIDTGPPRDLLPKPPRGRSHLYVSEHNPGARKLVESILVAAPASRRDRANLQLSALTDSTVAGDAEWDAGYCGWLRSRARSCVFVLYLDARTWCEDGDRTRREALQKDLVRAMELQSGAAIARVWRRAPDVVEAVIGDTRRSGRDRMYAETAVSLHSGVYRPVSIQLAILATRCLRGAGR